MKIKLGGKMNLEKEIWEVCNINNSGIQCVSEQDVVRISKKYATEMCKRQREICKKIIAKMDVSKLYLTPQELIIIENEIINSPLVTEE